MIKVILFQKKCQNLSIKNVKINQKMVKIDEKYTNLIKKGHNRFQNQLNGPIFDIFQLNPPMLPLF